MTANEGPLHKPNIDAIATEAMTHYADRWQHFATSGEPIPVDIPLRREGIKQLLINASRTELDGGVVEEGE